MGDALVKLYLKQNYVIGEDVLKAIKKNNLSLDEALLIIYFIGSNGHPVLDVEEINQKFGIDDIDVMKAFASLSSKNLIAIKMQKNKEGKMEEIIDLTPLYQISAMNVYTKTNEDKIKEIFNTFEGEFGRPLSSMEYDIINRWLDKGTPEELINQALKEAIYNGTLTLRYIDAIISEWLKKGFKTADDVDVYLKKKHSSKPKIKEETLFEYNWLDDDE